MSKYINDNISLAKTDLLYTYLPIALLGSLVCATIIFIGLYERDVVYLKEWYVAVILITLVRVASLIHYKMVYKNKPIISTLPLRSFMLSTIMNAIIWALLGSMMMPKHDQMGQMIIIVIIAGISAGAAQSLQPYLKLSVTYSCILILSLSGWLISQQTVGYYFLSVAMMTYFIFIVASTWRGNIILTQSLKLYFENILLNKNLREQATHDPVTKLFNRRYLNTALPKKLKRTLREQRSLCIAMIDIDHFKKINDTYGHEVGDIALKTVSQVLIRAFKEEDIICRFGGDEFMLATFDTTIHTLLPKLENVRRDIQNTVIQLQDTTLPPITVSIGIAEAPTQAKTTKGILALADKALYLAKTKGRNCIACLPMLNPPTSH